MTLRIPEERDKGNTALSSTTSQPATLGTQRASSQLRTRLRERRIGVIRPGDSALGRLDILTMALLAVGLLALYSATLVPGVFDGDYGEFQYMPRLLGLPHPTGYPLYLLLGWLWSWLPLGSLAYRMNLFSALWGVVTALVLFQIGRERGLSRVASFGGALALSMAPFFWRYAGLAAVYTLHTAILATALLFWQRWSLALQGGTPYRKWFALAALATGLSLTNHPTAAFLVPASLLFVVLHVGPFATRGLAERPAAGSLLAGALLFALPGLLYLYVPLRLWAIGPGIEQAGLLESIAKGYIAPFLDWNIPSVVKYITGRSLLGEYSVEWGLLISDLPSLLRTQFGPVYLILGVVGAFAWLRRTPRSFVLTGTLFLLAAVYAVNYHAEFASRNQIAHLEGHLLPAMVVVALWSSQAIDAVARSVSNLIKQPRAAGILALPFLLVLLFGVYTRAELPTDADRIQSQSIHTYWTEILSYPLEPAAALTAHWGDLTSFWYFQQGEGQRRDLWAIFPPNREQIAAWLAESDHVLYVAGPLMDWAPELSEEYELIPWGILVRVARPGSDTNFPSVLSRQEQFGEQLQLEGYEVAGVATDRAQLWLQWRTTAPTPRDLSVSVRLHAPDGSVLLQKDGRLASLWYPEGTMPEGQQLLSVFDMALPEALPPGTTARIVVYEPQSGQPLLASEGQDVVELGPFEP